MGFSISGSIGETYSNSEILKMKIRVHSDLHHEFFPAGKFALEVKQRQKDTVLVLAGDIDNDMMNLALFVRSLNEHFKAVILVPGNHEYYNGSYEGVNCALRQLETDVYNFYLLQDNTIIIDDVLFVGSTMWTDFYKENPVIMGMAGRRMNDYNYIDYHGKTLRPTDVALIHRASKEFVFKTLARRDADQKVVVITHHAPSYQLQNEDYRHQGDINYCYYNDFDDLIYEHQPTLWLYGHTHASTWLELDNAVIASNPHGYHRHSENPNYKDDFTIDISGKKAVLLGDS